MTRAITWLLPLATLAVYLWLVLGYGLELQRLAGGQQVFDLRIMGYDLGEARAYLVVLPPEGYAMYLGPIARLDTAFPILMGLTLLWWMRPLGTPFGLVCAFAAGAYVTLDLLENQVVAVLFTEGPMAITREAVAAASLLTQAKFMAFGLAVVLAARAAWLRRRA